MRTFTGAIVSNRMRRTVVVRVERLRRHPKYRAYQRVSRRLKAHAEEALALQMGDVGRIAETRPLSREKRWKVTEVIRRRAPTGQESEVTGVEAPGTGL